MRDGESKVLEMKLPGTTISWGGSGVYISPRELAQFGRLAVVSLLVVALLFGARGEPSADGISAEDRAATIDIGGCGDASDRSGSGFLFEDGVIVTAAHLVVQGDNIDVSIGRELPVQGTVVELDLQRDLAWVAVPETGVDRAVVFRAEMGQTGRVVGASASGTVGYVVAQLASLSIEEVLGDERTTRLGYELAADTTSGDSGAGAYDEQDRLIGMVFAVSADGSSTWAIAAEEIVTFLQESDRSQGSYVCEPAVSRIGRSS